MNTLLEMQAEAIPASTYDRLARPLVDIIAGAFNDPAIIAEYEHWQQQKYKNRKEETA